MTATYPAIDGGHRHGPTPSFLAAAWNNRTDSAEQRLGHPATALLIGRDPAGQTLLPISPADTAMCLPVPTLPRIVATASWHAPSRRIAVANVCRTNDPYNSPWYVAVVPDGTADKHAIVLSLHEAVLLPRGTGGGFKGSKDEICFEIVLTPTPRSSADDPLTQRVRVAARPCERGDPYDWDDLIPWKDRQHSGEITKVGDGHGPNSPFMLSQTQPATVAAAYGHVLTRAIRGDAPDRFVAAGLRELLLHNLDPGPAKVLVSDPSTHETAAKSTNNVLRKVMQDVAAWLDAKAAASEVGVDLPTGTTLVEVDELLGPHVPGSTTSDEEDPYWRNALVAECTSFDRRQHTREAALACLDAGIIRVDLAAADAPGTGGRVSIARQGDDGPYWQAFDLPPAHELDRYAKRIAR